MIEPRFKCEFSKRRVFFKMLRCRCHCVGRRNDYNCGGS